ncbi:MAG: carbohydrate ABC transporter permease [Anaerolineae bacterium]|nr:carbohydrate ABC transporter permease [Anaerolineae bacterium]
MKSSPTPLSEENKTTKAGFFYRLQTIGGRALLYLTLAIWGFIALVPFLWMISTSLMTLGEAVSGDYVTKYKLLESFEVSDTELDTLLGDRVPDFIRDNKTLNPGELKQTAREFIQGSETYLLRGNKVYRGGLVNYMIAWQVAEFDIYIMNSIKITLITLGGELIISIMAAYAFARMNWPGRDLIFGILVSTLMIPGMVTIIPNFLTITWLGRISPFPWLNNWPALTIPFMGSIFSIFLLRQFFTQIPDDLFDAAQIDGASHWQFLLRVAIPLSAAPIMVIIVLSFIGTWNALAWPLLVTNTPDWRPIAVGLFNFVDEEAGSKINLQMAGSMITIVPILILYFFTQKQFTESIARTGMKG